MTIEDFFLDEVLIVTLEDGRQVEVYRVDN